MSEVNSNEIVEVTEPIALDSTLQSLVTAVQDLSEAVAPSNAYVDIAATLSVSGWSNATPSVYTWTDNKVTGSCGIQVFFANGAENNPTPYLDYEKGVGSVILYAPSKPTSDVPVVFRIINADAEIASNIDATMVSTDAISGSSNVQQALGSVNSSISALNSKITQLDTLTTFELSTSDVNPNISFSIGYQKLTKYGKVCTLNFRITVSAQIAGWSTLFYITNNGAIPVKDQYFPIAQNITAAITTTGKIQLLVEALPVGSYSAFVVYFVNE